MTSIENSNIMNEYRNWMPGQNIFISAPTGSGKTQFVLKHLTVHIEDERKIAKE